MKAQGPNLTEHELISTRINNIVYYSTMLPVGLVGNVLTLAAVVMTLRTRTSYPNLLIGILACNDLVAILACHLITVASMASGGYVGGEPACLFQSMMSYTYFKMGFFTKCCISLDRYIALAFPLKYRRMVTRKKVFALTVHNVVFSIGSSALTLIIDPQYVFEVPTSYMCVNDFQYRTTYKTVVVIIEGGIFSLGSILFLISNLTVIRVMLEMKIKSKKGSALSGGTCKTVLVKTNAREPCRQPAAGCESPAERKPPQLPMLKSSSKAVIHQPGKSATEKSRSSQRKELYFAKLVTVIVTVFVILWIPYMTVIYWEYHNQDFINPLAKDIAIKLVFANCCFNPVLYGLFNRNFRKAYLYYIQLAMHFLSCKLYSRPSDEHTPWYNRRAHTYVTNVVVNGQVIPVQQTFSENSSSNNYL